MWVPMAEQKSRSRERVNNSPLDVAGWIVGPLVLAFLSVSVQVVAENPFFLAAHGTSAPAFAVIIVAGIAGFTAAVWAILLLVHRFASPRVFDLVASIAVFLAVALALVGPITKVLANATGSTIAWLLGIAAGVAGGVGIAQLSRRTKVGKAVVLIAAAVTIFPIAMLVISGASSNSPATIAFDDSVARPPILLLLADELSYSVVAERDGAVRPTLPNLHSLQQTSTTFTNAYATANATHFAVPTLLAGIPDASRQGEYPQEITASGGPLSWLQSRYQVATDSIYFQSNDDGVPFVDLTSGSTLSERSSNARNPWQMLGLDFFAVTGRAALPAPVSDAFPTLDDRWYDFWDVEPEPEPLAAGGDFLEVLTDQSTPGMVFWHSMITHTPYVRDYEGGFWTPNSLGLKEGGLGTEAVVELQRQVYASGAMSFDNQLGWVMNELRAAGTFDETLIIVTADHGRTFPLDSTWRVGDNRDQRWADVVHVPLFVKMPGQTQAEVVTELRSTAQISRTMLDAAGAQVRLDDGPELAPALDEELPNLPVFWFDKRTGEAGVEEYAPFTSSEVWDASYFQPRHPSSPFAVGIPRDLIGARVPASWTPVATFPGDPDDATSSQRAIEVTRAADACPSEGGFGPVAREGIVIGSLAWGPDVDGTVTGWGVVPEAGFGDYAIYCRES